MKYNCKLFAQDEMLSKHFLRTPNNTCSVLHSLPSCTGHIGIAVPDVNKACKRFDELGVKFVKKPDDGKS